MEATDSIPPQIPGYTFAQKLGSGSEANVYLYQQLSLSRQVAIKVSKGMLDPRAAARFRSEANFMGKISSHPYILSVYESGITATGNGYAVFEYSPGGNYKTFLESNRLNADQMLTVGINLASALFTAHREGIIHRDIKPSNILINTHGMPMLSDFGIAGTIYGSPGIGYTIAWAPPEVLAKNGGGNESSDIYSLGATLFAMLTGQSPYEYGYSAALGATRGKERGALLRNIILTNPLPKLNSPDIPPQVERILRKALNETPEDRYYSAYDFARDMQRTQQGGRSQLTENGDDDAAQQREYDGRVHGLLHGLAVAAADGVCDDDIRAKGDADEQVDDERDERAVCADGGDGNGLVRAGEVADNGNVGGVEQLFQNGCCGDRQGKLRQLAPDRAVEHVEPLAFCGSHVEFLLSIQKHLDCGPSIAQSAPQRKHFSGFSQTLEDCTGTARRMEPFPCSLFRGCGQMSEERGRNQYTPGMQRMSSSNACRSVSCMQHGK